MWGRRGEGKIFVLMPPLLHEAGGFFAIGNGQMEQRLDAHHFQASESKSNRVYSLLTLWFKTISSA